MVIYICEVTGLYKKWFPDESITPQRVQKAAATAAQFFESRKFQVEIVNKRPFWLDCPVDRPYLFLAITKYSKELRSTLREGADVLLEVLLEKDNE